MMDNTINELHRRIKELETQVSYLNSQLKLDDKFGLNWINVPEAFEKESENKIPILEEVPELAITNDDGKPTHILIEGDNYHALTCLNYTHNGKIDLIYIDPPYNTGSDGFTYKDKRFLDKFPDGQQIPKNHPLRHSVWLSFMEKRLRLAKQLLSDKGVIFISIDDNEQANLKLLCDKIFDASNFIGNLSTIMNLKGNQDEFGFAGTHEYTIVYAKNINSASIGYFPIEEDELDDWNIDEKGYFKKGATLKRTGNDAPREKRPYCFYPILVSKTSRELSTITKEEYKTIYNPATKQFDDLFIDVLREKYSEYEFILPIVDGKYASWRWGYETLKQDASEVIITEGRDGTSLYKKQRPELSDLPTQKPKSLLYKNQYSSGNGTAELKAIFDGQKKFRNPKPLCLIKDFEILATSKSSIILDFFAGSGTTLHATMKLNEEDNGHRQCILVNNNEGNICREVTYERNKRAIAGYGKEPSLGNSLKYFHTGFIGNNTCDKATDEDKIALAQKAGFLLAIAENTLYEQRRTDNYQIFKDKDKDIWTAVYFKEDVRPKFFESFLEEINQLKGRKNVYIFSWGDVSSFESYFDKISGVNLKSIPQPILDIYKSLNS